MIMHHYFSLFAATRSDWFFLSLPSPLTGKRLQQTAERMRRSKTVLICAHTGGNHWVAAVLDVGTNKLSAFDSQPKHDHLGTETTAQHITKQLAPFGPLSPSSTPMTAENVDCPRQSDKHSCGVFALVFALHLAADVALPATLSIHLWRQLFLALARQTPLASVLNPRILQVQHPPPEPAPLLPPPPTAPVSDNQAAPLDRFAHERAVARHMQSLADRLAAEACAGFRHCRDFYDTYQRDEILPVWSWVETEVAPVFGALSYQAKRSVESLEEESAAIRGEITRLETVSGCLREPVRFGPVGGELLALGTQVEVLRARLGKEIRERRCRKEMLVEVVQSCTDLDVGGLRERLVEVRGECNALVERAERMLSEEAS
jgi:hypothetical protein